MYEQVIMVDFDGTIVKHAFPRIGEPLPHAWDVLKELKAAGYRLILWTCRENGDGKWYLDEAVDFCRENGVEFDAVNEALVECDFRSEKCLKRKPHAHCVIDDRNLGGFPGWEAVREAVLGSKATPAKEQIE